jgi:transposase InsO family protein
VEAHHRATSLAAARFLDVLLERMPFKIVSLQIDGGSEFAVEFEEACQQREVRRFMLPPLSPKLNAHVECAHRTHNEGFYEGTPRDSHLPKLNCNLQEWEKIYNTFRPHQSLSYHTPLEFVRHRRRKQRKAK